MKVKQWLRANLVFLLVLAAIGLMLCLNLWGKYLGKIPLADREALNNPVQVHLGGDGRYYYVTESSREIWVTDGEHVLQYQIRGGDAEAGFETASAVAAVPAGTLYVLDAVAGEDGIEIAEERILRYSPKGRLEGILFSSLELDEDGGISLSGLSAWGDAVYFTAIAEQGVVLYKLEENHGEPLKVLELEDVAEYVMDCAVDGEGNVSVLLRNGDVLTWRDGWDCIYSARDNDTEAFFSLVSEIDYGPSGELYLCDSGQREVRRLSGTGELTTVLARGSFAQKGPETFAEMLLFSGLNAANGVVSVLAAEYRYQAETDEEIFFYSLAGVSEEGEELFCADSVGVSAVQRLCTALAYLAAVMAVLAVAAAVMVFRFLKQADIPGSTRFQLVMVVTALAVTLGVSQMIFENCNARFIGEASANLVNIAYRVAQGIDSQALAALDSPDACTTDAYRRFDGDIREVLDGRINESRSVYCVVYKVRNDVVCEAYQSDEGRGLMFPLAGRYAGGVEERIARENSYNVTYESLAEGTYLYAILPYYGADGEPAAFIELGTDYTSFSQDTHDLYIQVLLLAVMAVIITMLLFSEALCGGQAVRGMVRSRRKKQPCPPEVIRPLAFLYFAVANISTAFLPVYGMQLWQEDFPLRAELAAALPLTSEMITAAVAAFLCGFLVKRVGVRLVCVGGAALYIAGNLSSAFAGNLWVLIGANAVCGAGSGCLTLALNAWAAGYSDEERQNQGFIHINAAYLAGLNCGTVIGSIISDTAGIRNTFLIAAAVALALTVLCAGMIGRVSTAGEEEEELRDGHVALRELFTPRVIRYFLCISVPYLTCTAFLEYFFPIEAEANGLSATQISMAFLLSGLISIYAGSSLAEPITERIGSKRAMLLASFLYAAALIYLVVNPAIMSCYVVVVLFAAADSFGLSAQSVYFASLPAVKRVGQSMALGVNSTVESVTSACGSLVFGAALMLGTQQGILLIAAAFTLLTVLFVIGERKEESAGEPEPGTVY